MTEPSSSQDDARRGSDVVPTIVPIMMSARSGSSVVAHAVQRLGADFGDRLRAPKPKNPKGFFEDRDIRRLSKVLHRAVGGRSRFSLVPEARWDDPALVRLEDEAVTLLRSRFGGAQCWGFKNGRILRYLPFWERVLARLDGDVRYVFATRNPLAAAVSRDRARAVKLMGRGGGVALNLYQWLVEVLPYFERLRGRSLLVVDFDRLVADPSGQMRRLSGYLGFGWNADQAESAQGFAEEFLSTGLRHHRYGLAELEADPRVPRLAAEAYCWLDGLAGDRVAPADEALWSAWTALRGALWEWAPLLDFAGESEQALWRAQIDPLSPLALLGRRLRQRFGR